MKCLPINTWRIETRNGIDVGLVGPGFNMRVDKGITERLAVPQKVKGPFLMHDNGYGTIQIFDKDHKYRLITAVSYYHDCKLDNDQRLTPEEALYIACTIVKALNQEQERS